MQAVKRGLQWAFCAVGSFSAFAGEAMTYYHSDFIGSPVAATDQAGYVRWRAAYRPYGDRDQTATEQLASADNKKWFTGHVHDEETGLTYAGARYYDPALGRFRSVDPIGFSEKNEQSFGRYTYVNNNPYRYVDPNGKELKVAGTEVFNQQVQTNLEALRSGPSGAALVRAIEESTFVVTIRETAGTSHAIFSWKDATNFRGSDTDVYFNPNDTGLCCDESGGRERPPFTTLAHELGHAKLAVRGTHPERDNEFRLDPRVGGTPKDEAPALAEENKVRQEHNVPIRPLYIPPQQQQIAR